MPGLNYRRGNETLVQSIIIIIDKLGEVRWPLAEFMQPEIWFCRERLLNELRETEEASRRQAEVLVKVSCKIYFKFWVVNKVDFY